MTAEVRAGDVLAAVLEADPQAVFVVDPDLRVLWANSRGERLRATRQLFHADHGRLTGATRRVDVQLSQAVSATAHAAGDPPPPFVALNKPAFTVELRRLELTGQALVLVRVFEGYAAPGGSGDEALELVDRGATTIHRRLSAKRNYGPREAAARPPLPPLAPLQAFEAYARLGSMTPASEELGAWAMTISRAVRSVETATGRTLVEGVGQRKTLTPEGRQLARALTNAFDILEAAVRPRPPGGRRGRKPAAIGSRGAATEAPDAPDAE